MGAIWNFEGTVEGKVSGGSQADQDRWLRLEGHLTSALSVTGALIESTGERSDPAAKAEMALVRELHDVLESAVLRVRGQIFPSG